MINDQLEIEKGTKMVVTLRENALPEIEEFHDGISLGKGSYSHEAYANAILQSLEYEAVRTPLLPKNTIYYSEGPSQINVFFEVPSQSRKAYYHEAVIDDVPYPNLVFGIVLKEQETKKIITRVYIAALEDEFVTNEESKVFCYPYTNVSNSDFSVCWGSHQLTAIERVTQLSSLPEQFFNTPNSDSYYSGSNSSSLSYRDLVEEIKGKAFPEKYLKPTGLSLQDWIRKTTSLI